MTKRSGPGRPPMGKRHYVNAPLPPHVLKPLLRYSELTGEPMGPTVAKIFEAHLKDLRLDELEAASAVARGQEVLDFRDAESKKTA